MPDKIKRQDEEAAAAASFLMEFYGLAYEKGPVGEDGWGAFARLLDAGLYLLDELPYSQKNGKWSFLIGG